MNTIAKFLFSSLTVLLLMLFTVAPVLAKSVPSTTNLLAPEPGSASLQGFQAALAQDDYNKESFDFASLTGTLSSLTTLLLGCSIQNAEGGINYDACPEPIRVGALPVMGNMMAAMITNPPASGIQYIADIGQKLNLVKPAYAQTGFGFGAINPFVTAWRAVRNLTYILFVVGMVIFGIMIMVRTKVSPQAVITVQSALPRIIIGLILITFSFAIAGLLIDLIYVIFGLLVWGLQIGGLYDPGKASQYVEDYRTAGFGQTAWFIFTRGLTGGWDALKNALGAAPILSGASGGLLGAAGTLVIKLIGAVALKGVAVALIPIALGFILAIIFFFFRVFFALAKAYFLLLLYLIFSPILILWGILKGNGIWESWLRGLTANILVFLFVGVIIFFTDVLINLVDKVGSGTLWAPPYVGGSQDIIKGIIALGAIMILPSIPDIINQLFGTKPLAIQLPQVQNQLQQGIGNLSQTVQRAWQQRSGG